jgi:hypothetical protein
MDLMSDRITLEDSESYFEIDEYKYYHSLNGVIYMILGESHIKLDPELGVILKDFVFFHEIPKGKLLLPELSWERFWHPYTMADLRWTQSAPLGYFQLDGKIIYRDNIGAIWTSDGVRRHEISYKALHDYAARYFNIPKGSGPPTDYCGQYGFWHSHSSKTFVDDFKSKPELVSTTEFTEAVFSHPETEDHLQNQERTAESDRSKDLLFLFLSVFLSVTIFQLLLNH